MAKKETVESLILSLVEKNENQYKDLDKRLDNIEKVMIAQEINLKEHMKRSDHLETLVSSIQEEDLKPIQKHVNTVEGVFKFIGLVSLLVGIIAGLLSLIDFIKNLN